MYDCTSSDTYTLHGFSGYLQARAREGRGQTTVESNRSGCKPRFVETWDRQEWRDHRRTVDVGASPAGQEQSRSGDVFWASDPREGNGRNYTTPFVFEAPLGHWMKKRSAKMAIGDRFTKICYELLLRNGPRNQRI